MCFSKFFMPFGFFFQAQDVEGTIEILGEFLCCRRPTLRASSSDVRSLEIDFQRAVWASVART